MTDDEQFVKIRQELCTLLVNIEDKQKKNNMLLQLDTLLFVLNKKG